MDGNTRIFNPIHSLAVDVKTCGFDKMVEEHTKKGESGQKKASDNLQ